MEFFDLSIDTDLVADLPPLGSVYELPKEFISPGGNCAITGGTKGVIIKEVQRPKPTPLRLPDPSKPNIGVYLCY